MVNDYHLTNIISIGYKCVMYGVAHARPVRYYPVRPSVNGCLVIARAGGTHRLSMVGQIVQSWEHAENKGPKRAFLVTPKLRTC